MDESGMVRFDSRTDFEWVYRAYFLRMRRFAREYVLWDEEAENVVQDVFALLWEKREELRVESNLDAYLFSLVKHRCLNYLRHQEIAEEYRQEQASKLYALERLGDGMGEVDLEEAIRVAIEKLPERCREIFVMSRMEGKKYREIAEALGLSANTVENQIGIALKKLREELRDYLPLLCLLLNVK